MLTNESVIRPIAVLLFVAFHVIAITTCLRRRRYAAIWVMLIGALGVLAATDDWFGSPQSMGGGFTGRFIWMLFVLFAGFPITAVVGIIVFGIAYALTKPAPATATTGVLSVPTTTTAVSLFFDVMFVLSGYGEMH